MRLLQLLGLGSILFGAFVLVRGFSYTSDRRVLEIGEFRASVEEKRSVPPWVGAIAVTAGLLLFVAGTRTRR